MVCHFFASVFGDVERGDNDFRKLKHSLSLGGDGVLKNQHFAIDAGRIVDSPLYFCDVCNQFIDGLLETGLL